VKPAVLFLIVAARLAAAAPREPVRFVTAVRHWSLSDTTRVAVEISGDFEFRSARAHNPERVYFDIPNCEPKVAPRQWYTETLEDPLAKRIRVAEHAPGITRVVIELADRTEVSTSQLANPNRLIVALHAGPALPLNTLPSAIAARVPAAPSETPMKTDTALTKEPNMAQSENSRAAAGSTLTAKLVRTVGFNLNGAIDPHLEGHDHGTEGLPRLGRSDDMFIPLNGRAALANEKTADLLLAPAVGDVMITLPVGTGTVVDCPGGVARVATSHPEAVDAVVAGEREVMFQAKALGQATLVVWSKTGERRAYEVTVDPDLAPLRRLLKDTFPGEQIDVRASRDSVALVGRASTQAVADRALALVTPAAKAAVNNLTVAPTAHERQILLRVRFAEVNRTASSELAFNLFSTGAAGTHGTIATGQFPSARIGDVSGTIPGWDPTATKISFSDVLNIFAFRPDLNLGLLIHDLQSRGLLQILAEPNLVATNGKEATFLAGGEFPVPIVQGGANVGAVTVQFKEFGIRLSFLPLFTGTGTLRLHVKPEVSTIDPANGVTVSGFRIPALSTRRVETDVELAEGQSFVIAGLLDEHVIQDLARVPGLADIPLLGALFRSHSLTKSRTELIVVVTPEPRSAMDGPPPVPPMPLPFLEPVVGGERKP
jgi:pilus assembly protein CpaC